MCTYLKTLLFELKEQKKVRRRFYSSPHFKAADKAFKQVYRAINPYKVSKQFLVQRGVCNPYQYGETPLTTMADIARECDLGPNDTVIEMGAGRGRAALFLAEYVGCRVLAYEQIPLFVEKMIPSNRLCMQCQDMKKAPFSKASWIFLYGTMLEDEEIVDFCRKVPKGVKVITVSYSLSHYYSPFVVEKVFSGRFPWGKTEIYVNCIR